MDDEAFMARALELAASIANTAGNPRVGAVLVRDGVILSEGLHAGAGTAHAEAVALEGVDASGATLYVTLEPCAHQGRMPPCAPAIVDGGVGRVVVAIEDPDPRVSGKGLALLRGAGIDVSVGVMAARARAVNESYIHHRTTGRPFVTLKLASSLDGRLAAADGSSRWISHEEARAGVHSARERADAVVVGSNTVIADDPLLTARRAGVAHQPIRVIVDSDGRVAPNARVFGSPGGSVVVATTARSTHEMQTAWKETGAEVLLLPESAGRVDLRELLDDFGNRGLTEVLFEGGAGIATSLIGDHLVDRLEIHFGNVVLGGGGPMIGDLGVPSLDQALRWRLESLEQAGDSVITRWRAR
jgi:diaminohydroxyphosphoribosylaminopyrimidine deaminase/5-amino-6-(5-phosphoribosylamino)uracil reductase